MTIQDIRFSMHSFDQAVYLGKALEAAGERLLLAGVFRKENSVTLCLFAEDEDVTQLQKERVKMEKKRQRGTLTLRDEKMLNLKEDGNNLMEFIRGIRVNGTEYEFRSGSGGRMEEYNLEGRCLVYHLLEHGVSFGFLEERPLSMVQCMAMELEGEYDRIPFSEQDLEDLAFLTAPRHYHVPVNQKMKVKIGAENGKMRKFTDAQERRAAEDAKGEHCGKQKFDKTIDQGLSILSEMQEEMAKAGTNVLSGEHAFKLYDTYGFPVDLTQEILEEKGFSIDGEGFRACMEEQRNKARSARKETNYMGADATVYDEIDASITTEFVGYGSLTHRSEITVLTTEAELTEALSDGQRGTIIVKETPFYATMGGQNADTGIISAGETAFSSTPYGSLPSILVDFLMFSPISAYRHFVIAFPVCIFSKRRSAARLLKPSTSRSKVVRGGSISSIHVSSPKPITEISSGHLMPVFFNAFIKWVVSRLPPVITAVGRILRMALWMIIWILSSSSPRSTSTMLASPACICLPSSASRNPFVRSSLVVLSMLSRRKSRFLCPHSIR